MSITFSVELHFVIFSASSGIVNTGSMCICPCNPTSTRLHSTLLRYHSTSGAISTSSTSEKSSPLLYFLTTTSTNSTSAPDSLRSSVCYCLCSTTSSTYLGQNASSSITESLTFFPRVLRAIIMKNYRILPVIR